MMGDPGINGEDGPNGEPGLNGVDGQKGEAGRLIKGNYLKNDNLFYHKFSQHFD